MAYQCNCVHSLFSMDTGSYFYSEEDDLRSWSYSKHLVEQERQEHIKRLREQGIIVPEEELVEEKGESFLFCYNSFPCFLFWYKNIFLPSRVSDKFDSTLAEVIIRVKWRVVVNWVL